MGRNSSSKTYSSLKSSGKINFRCTCHATNNTKIIQQTCLWYCSYMLSSNPISATFHTGGLLGVCIFTHHNSTSSFFPPKVHIYFIEVLSKQSPASGTTRSIKEYVFCLFGQILCQKIMITQYLTSSLDDDFLSHKSIERIIPRGKVKLREKSIFLK